MANRTLHARLHDLLSQPDASSSAPAIVALARQHRRVLSMLTALTYDLEPRIADRAVTAIGQAASAISDSDPEFVRGHLRRLFWLLNDESGGIGWRAAEAIGEIIGERPERFAEYVPNLVWLLDMEAEDAVHFRASTLRGILRVAEAMDLSGREDLVGLLRSLRDDADPEVRALAQRCLERVSGATLRAIPTRP